MKKLEPSRCPWCGEILLCTYSWGRLYDRFCGKSICCDCSVRMAVASWEKADHFVIFNNKEIVGEGEIRR